MILSLSFSSGIAQIDTNVLIIAKVDIAPQYELHDGNEIMLMGYTQTIGGAIHLPAPTLTFTEGDSVKLDMWNLSQGPPHTVHLHGLDVDQANDGVPHLSFAIEHDETGSYYFKAPHPGTYIYHCHETSVIHVQAGMYGLLIVRPAEQNMTWENGYEFHSEHAWMTSEVDTTWHADSIINHPHDPTAMFHIIPDYVPQHFLINGKSEQQLDNAQFEVSGSINEVIYIRLANVGYCGNRIHFPEELNARIISSDGRPLPQEEDSDSIEILPGERYGILLNAQEEFNDSIQIDYFSLDNLGLKNTQFVDVSIEGYLNTPSLSSASTLMSFPNPTEHTLYIPTSDISEDIVYIHIIDNTGKRISSSKVKITNHQSNGVIELNTQQLFRGSYRTQITTVNGTLLKTSNFIKN